MFVFPSKWRECPVGFVCFIKMCKMFFYGLWKSCELCTGTSWGPILWNKWSTLSQSILIAGWSSSFKWESYSNGWWYNMNQYEIYLNCININPYFLASYSHPDHRKENQTKIANSCFSSIPVIPGDSRIWKFRCLQIPAHCPSDSTRENGTRALQNNARDSWLRCWCWKLQKSTNWGTGYSDTPPQKLTDGTENLVV